MFATEKKTESPLDSGLGLGLGFTAIKIILEDPLRFNDLNSSFATIIFDLYFSVVQDLGILERRYELDIFNISERIKYQSNLDIFFDIGF